MQFRFENQGSHTYLVYDILQTEQLDSFVKGMLTNNKISGLANTIFTQVDKKYCIHYEISSMISASQLFTGTLNKKRMLGFFRGIMNAFIAVEEYMLDENMLILDCDYIFTNVSTGKTVMICLPVQNTGLLQEKKDVISFLRSILYHAKFDMDDDNSYIALLMNYFNSNTRFVAESFKILLDQLEEVKSKNPEPVIVQQKPSVQNIINPVQSIPQNPVAVNNTPPPIISQVSSHQETQITPDKTISNYSSVTLPNGSKMAIPGMENTTMKSSSAIKSENKTSTSETEQISWLYLMQHYNKENAAKYKAQKKAKKAEKKKSKEKNNTILVPETGHIPSKNQIPNADSSSFHQQTANQVQQVPVQSASTNVPTKQPVLQHTVYQGTTVLNPNMQAGTTVLNPNHSMKKKACLYRFKNRERIEIKGDFFRIGRESTYADYCIFDNSAISSSHAYIIHKNEKYYLVDTNSTNNTYINNSIIPSNAEKEIHDSDKICFADEEFEFKII